MSDVHDFLAERSTTGARSDPWTFAGRVDEIAQILRLSRNLPPKGKRSQTVLVQGPPGSGKTSLMTHVAGLLDQDSGASTGTCLLASPPRQWEGVNEVYGHLAAMLAGAPQRAGAPTVQDTSKFRAGVAGVGGERSRTRTLPPVTFAGASSIADWHHAAGAPAWLPKRRVVVFADEVQGVTPGTPAAALLEDLHAQTSIPVLLVCAGLPNSERRLAQANLSRIDHVLTLDGLSHGEAIECATETLLQGIERGVRGGDADVGPWASRIAQASDGWPRHLHAYLQATWQVLLEMEVPDLAAADIERAMAAGDAAREEYYRRRIDISGCPPPVLGALHERLAADGTIGERDARGTVRRLLRDGPDDERADWDERFPTLDDGFDAMLRAGVLGKDAGGRYCSPIPSLTRFILGSDAGDPYGRRPVAEPGASEAPHGRPSRR